MINFVNTCFFKPSLLLKSLCILTWELRSCRFILRWKEMKPFLQYNFFSNSHYFWNPLFACLFAKYLAGGLFDERNEGSFFTWGFRFTRVTVENALLCFTAPNAKHHKLTQNSVSLSCQSKQDSRCCINFPHELTCQILTNQSIKIGRRAWPTREHGEKSQKQLSSLPVAAGWIFASEVSLKSKF